MSMVRSANAFIDQTRPWTLAKDPEQAARLDAVLGSLVRALIRIAVTLSPFMPGKCDEIWTRLGGDDELPWIDSIVERFPARIPDVAGGVLFPRLEA
jgi:methionyl-tRNA synthetase